MKWFVTWLMGGMLLGTSAIAGPQLQLVAEAEPQAVFGGTNPSISLCWRNAGETANETQIQSRTMQLTSATAVCVGEAPWKKLQVLPGQTVLESAVLDFPSVRAETRFLIQWCDGASNVLGATDVLVYPTNLLEELGVLMNHDENALGIYDPLNQIKPLLKNEGVKFVDLENVELEKFRGKLAIVGPFESKAEIKNGLANEIKTIAKNGAAVVWVQPPAAARDWETQNPQPSFYSMPQGNSVILIVQAEMMKNLPGNPRGQFNLIYFCKLALRPKMLTN
jgi:hypothetical protein